MTWLNEGLEAIGSRQRTISRWRESSPSSRPLREGASKRRSRWDIRRGSIFWFSIGGPAHLLGVLVSGVNDVINSQRSCQGAWLNRIPVAAWALVMIIGIGSCWLIGYRARRTDWLAFLLVPIAVSICFFLIADLDSPRGGAIRVTPQNLSILSRSLPAAQ